MQEYIFNMIIYMKLTKSKLRECQPIFPLCSQDQYGQNSSADGVLLPFGEGLHPAASGVQRCDLLLHVSDSWVALQSFYQGKVLPVAAQPRRLGECSVCMGTPKLRHWTKCLNEMDEGKKTLQWDQLKHHGSVSGSAVLLYMCIQ